MERTKEREKERKKERKKETRNEASVESAEPPALTFDPYVHLTYINTHDSKQHRMQVRALHNNIFQYSNIQYTIFNIQLKKYSH